MRSATSIEPAFGYLAEPAAQGLSWYVTFAPAAGKIPSMIVSTENGPESTVASAGTLTGMDPTVRVTKVVEGGLPTELASFHSATQAYDTPQ